MERIHGGDRLRFLEEYGREPLDFSASVNVLGMPEPALKAAREALEGPDRYPDMRCRALSKALALHHQVREEKILCGSGAADLIFRYCLALRPSHALIPVPAFSEYAQALKAAGCEKIEQHPTGRDTLFTPGRSLLERLRTGPEPDLLILCEPGNPSGRTTPAEVLEEIVSLCRQKGIRLLVDECFMDFLEDGQGRSLICRIEEAPVTVLRAFTKFYGMAKLRLGYCISADTQLLKKMARAGSPWPVSEAAMAAGEAALGDAAYPDRVRSFVKGERVFIQEALEKEGCFVVPGEANFLLFLSPDADLGEKLKEKGILIRDCSGFSGLEKGWYRIGVRTREENEKLITAVRMIIQGSGRDRTEA